MICGHCTSSFMAEPHARHILGLSKAQMKEIIESGELETFTREGSKYRWVTREALMDWEMKQIAKRRRALRELMQISEELELHGKTLNPIQRGKRNE